MFGIGEEEFLIILLFVFLVFGPDKLPGMGRTIGRAIKQFRNAQDDLSRVVKTELQDPVQNLMDSVDLKSSLQDGDGKSAAEADKDGSVSAADGTKGKTASAAASDGDSQASKEASQPQESFAEKKARLSAAALYGLDKPEKPAADQKQEEPVQESPAADAPVSEETPKPEKAEESEKAEEPEASKQTAADKQAAEAAEHPEADGKE